MGRLFYEISKKLDRGLYPESSREEVSEFLQSLSKMLEYAGARVLDTDSKTNSITVIPGASRYARNKSNGMEKRHATFRITNYPIIERDKFCQFNLHTTSPVIQAFYLGQRDSEHVIYPCNKWKPAMGRFLDLSSLGKQQKLYDFF